MKKLSKLISALLSVILIFSVLTVAPFTVSAVEYTYNGYKYTVSNSKAKITGYTGSSTSLNIPSSLGGYTVNAIGSNAFQNNTKITSITIPNSVVEIGKNSFADCTKVTTVSIGNRVTEMGDYAFAGCLLLNKVTISSGTEIIGYGAFQDCTSLSTVTIPNTVVKIDGSAFYNCTYLSSVSIPSSVKTIGNSAFYNCKNMSYLSIGNGVTSIKSYAFQNCYKLTSITIPNSVIEIGKNSFADCTKVTTVSIGNSVTEMGDYAFAGCTSLNKVSIAEGTTIIGYGAFRGCTSLKHISIPDPFIKIGNAKLNNENLEDSSVFYNCPSSLTIYGKSGSFAQKFAKANGIKFSTGTMPSGVDPTSVSLNLSTLTLGVGESYGITKTISPSNATQTCTWTSSNSSVASVNSSGKITANGTGTTYISVKTSNGLTSTCKVTVKPAPTSVKTNLTSITLGKGETYTISESTNSGTYANASNLKWSSTNTSVATVTKGSANKATITAKGVGTAYVKITLYNGKTAQCKVTVKNAPSSVKTNPTSITLGKGETYTISESTNSGSYANAANLKWSSTNTSVATVTKGSGNKAVITAKGVGTAYVKITLYNGKTATCKVTVKPAPTSVKLSKTSITLNKGQTYTISESTNSGSYANAANLKWSSTNTSVATVTKGSGNKATITAKAKGTAYIKITLYNGKTAQCKVTVK